jgi:NifU-like protein involved in Fe-S cluster formation
MNAPITHKLYSLEILRLATSLPHNDSLEMPQASATCRAPVCGSEMAVDVALDDTQHITGLAIRAKACALGQASAAVLHSRALGQNADQIRQISDNVKAVLDKGSGDLVWLEFEPFRYASDFPARHGAIMLPFDTLLAALEKPLR